VAGADRPANSSRYFDLGKFRFRQYPFRALDAEHPTTIPPSSTTAAADHVEEAGVVELGEERGPVCEVGTAGHS
jgi:hypothetical protein